VTRRRCRTRLAGMATTRSMSAACCYAQRAELSRAQVESSELYDWFDFMYARFELLDGDAEIVPGIRVVATAAHTCGRQ